MEHSLREYGLPEIITSDVMIWTDTRSAKRATVSANFTEDIAMSSLGKFAYDMGWYARAVLIVVAVLTCLFLYNYVVITAFLG